MNPLHVIDLVLLTFVLASLVFAFRWGGKHERIAAGLFTASMVVTWTAQVHPIGSMEAEFLVIDIITGIAFLTLLVRSREIWVGAACCAQMLVVTFTATRFFHFPLSEATYVTMLQLSAVSLCASIAWGTWARRWGRQDDLLESY